MPNHDATDYVRRGQKTALHKTGGWTGHFVAGSFVAGSSIQSNLAVRFLFSPLEWCYITAGAGQSSQSMCNHICFGA